MLREVKLNIIPSELSLLVAEVFGAKLIQRLTHVGVTLVDFGQGEMMCPPYAESVDAVLPLLKNYWWSRGIDNCVTVCRRTDKYPLGMGHSPIFHHLDLNMARAFCFALLKANGFKVIS